MAYARIILISRQGTTYELLLPATYLSSHRAVLRLASLTRSARPGPGTRGVPLVVGVGRRANYEPPRQPKPKIPLTAVASARCSEYGTCGFGPHPSLLLALLPSRSPCAPQRHPADTLLQSIRRESSPRAYEPMYACPIAPYSNVGTPPALCCLHMHAAEACVRGSADIRFEKLRRLIARRPAS